MDVIPCAFLHISQNFFCSLVPKASSVWSGLPLWLLLLIQYLMGLAATATLAIVGALFWPVAAVYYYGIAASNKSGQHAVAIIAFIIAIILYGITLTVFLIIGIVLWVVWIIKDIDAVTSNTERPKLFHEYYSGLNIF